MGDDLELLQLIASGSTAFELLHTGLELDLFEHLERSGPMDLPAVAAALDIEEQPARVLLLGLTAFRLIGKDGAEYVNTPLAQHFLLRSKPMFIGRYVDVQARIVNPCMVDLAESVRRDTNAGLRHLPGSGTTVYAKLHDNPELQQVFYDNMGEVSKRTIPPLLESFDFSGLRHVLDIGGGDGASAIELARRHPHLAVTVSDSESVTRLAAQNAETAGLGDRVRVRSGDLFRDPFPDDVDAVLSCHIFEVWSLRRNTELLRKCHAALPPGGTVLIYTLVSEDQGTGPLIAGIMSAYFQAVASGEGMVYPGRDVEETLRSSGFERVERVDEGMAFGHALFVGTK